MQPLGDWGRRWLLRNMVVWGGKEVSAYRGVGVSPEPEEMFLTQMGRGVAMRRADCIARKCESCKQLPLQNASARIWRLNERAGG
jgi:hypothetical protein